MHKKIWNLILAFLMMMTMIPIATMAEDSEYGVSLDKTVRPVPGKLNEWEIDLSVRYDPKPIKKDIVLIIDKSASMINYEIESTGETRLTAAKNAAYSFIDKVLNDDPRSDLRMAIVEYSSGSEISQTFTKDKELLKDTVKSIKAEGGTFTQAALKQTRDYIKEHKREDAETIVVVLTDGAATYGYGLSDSGLAKIEKTKHRVLSQKDFDINQGGFVDVGRGIWQRTFAKEPLKIAEYNLSDPKEMLVKEDGILFEFHEENKNWHLVTGDVDKNLKEEDFDYESINKIGGPGRAAPLFLYKMVNGKNVYYDTFRNNIADLGNISNRNNADYYFIDLLNTMIAEMNFLKEQTGSDVYTVAIGLEGLDPLAEQAVKEMATDDNKFFTGDGSELSQQFDDIANEIQFPLEQLSLKTFDPMGEAFDIVEDSVVHVYGEEGGLRVEDNKIYWDMNQKSFQYVEEQEAYIASITYRIVLNEKAPDIIEKLGTIDLDTNGDAYFEYKKDGKINKEFFPKPKVKPSILKVSKELYDQDNNRLSLKDKELQREYHYQYELDHEIVQDFIRHDKEKVYHIFQSLEDLEFFESHILHDDINRFDIEYVFNDEILEIQDDRVHFSLNPGSGINHLIIRNKINDYKNQSFRIEKSVEDANQNGVAEIGEILHYSIDVINDSEDFIREMSIQDDLKELIPYIESHDDQKLKVFRNQEEVESAWTLKDLKEGFISHLAPKESLRLSFDLKVIEDENLPKNLINIAMANDKKAESSIPVVLPSYQAKKEVWDGNQNGFAEASEQLTYRIQIDNNGEVVIPKLKVMDDLKHMKEFIDFEKSQDELVKFRNQTIDLETFIQDGLILENIEVDETIEILFSVYIKDDFDADEIEVLENSAFVGDKTVEEKIKTGKAKVTAFKEVQSENEKNHVKSSDRLNYKIIVKNDGDVEKKSVMVRDTLSTLNDYIITDNHDEKGTVKLISSEEETLYSINELKEGIEINVPAHSELEFHFDLFLRDDLDEILDDGFYLENTATVDHLTPKVNIQFAKPIIKASKYIEEEFKDQLIEAGENIRFNIAIENIGSAKKEELFIRDDLSELRSIMDPSQNFDEMYFTLEHKGHIETRALSELDEGFKMDLGAQEKILISFTIKIAENLDVEKKPIIKNTAQVGEEYPSVEMKTGKSELISSKHVVDENKNGLAEKNEKLFYTIEIENIGNVNKRDVFIQDDLKQLQDFIQADLKTFKLNGQEEKIEKLEKGFTMDIEAQEKVIIEFTVQIKEDFDADQIDTLINIATVDNKKLKESIKTGKYNIKTNKSVKDQNQNHYAELGERLNYKIEIQNTGTVKKENLTIQDDLKEIIDYIEDPSLLNFKLNGQERPMKELMDGFELDVDAQEYHIIEFSVFVKEDLDFAQVNELKNVAKVGENTPSISIKTGRPVIIAEKTLKDSNGDDLAEAGENLHYTISVENIGEVSKDDVWIQDDLRELLDYVDDISETQMFINGQAFPIQKLVNGFEIELGASETIMIDFILRVKENFDATEVETLDNTAVVDDQEIIASIKTGQSIIQAYKFVQDENNNGYAEPGENLEYQIKIENIGTVLKKNVYVQDQLNNLEEYLVIDPHQKIMIQGVEYSVDDLQKGIYLDIEAGESLAFSFTVQVKENLDVEEVQVLKNTANIDDDDVTAEIKTAKEKLSITKEVFDENNNHYAEPGEILTYRITVKNIGSIQAQNVFIQDSMNDLMDYIERSQLSKMTLNGKKDHYQI